MLNSHTPRFGFTYELFDKNGNLKSRQSREEPIFHDTLTLTVRTKEGLIVSEKTFPVKSFLQNFGYILDYSYMTTVNSTTLIEALTGGATNPDADVHNMELNEIAIGTGVASAYGIWIGDMDDKGGDGLTAESGIGNIIAFDDYMLRRKILNEGLSPETDVTYRATNVSISGDILTVSRKFQNNDTTSKYVDEVGIVVIAGADHMLICRDIVTQTEIPTTQVLEVKYKFQVTTASGLTRNWIRSLSSEFVDGNAVEQMVDIENSAQTVDLTAARTQKDLAAADNIDTHGIVLGGYVEGAGIGILPFTTEDYKLGAKLDDGDIDYGPMVALAQTMTLGYTTVGMYRDFENDRSDEKTIYALESGLYMKELAGGNFFMLGRDRIEDNPSEEEYIAVPFSDILRVKAYLKLALTPAESE